jgi:hypothetical protein
VKSIGPYQAIVLAENFPYRGHLKGVKNISCFTSKKTVDMTLLEEVKSGGKTSQCIVRTITRKK